ncbi:MAG: amidohydrolase family protein [Acidobacteria bacterium]|nr:amidohydrolase family protein [Acidobacteriota bacterium]
MTNRRQFLRRVAGTMAGGCAMGLDLVDGATQAPSARRQVTIGNRRIRVVDMHAHWEMALPEIVKGTAIEKTAPPFVMRSPGPGLAERIAVMDKMGVDIAAISINYYWWNAATDRGLARAICTAHNEGLAKWSRAYPDRLVGLASVPLQFPDLAAELLQDATMRLGARGVTIGGHVAGEPVTLPKYDPFWAKVEELGLLVFMHPDGAENVAKPGSLEATAGGLGMGNIIGNPLETTVFLSRLIFDGTFDRFPGLRVCGAHGGGYLPSYLGRSEVACGRPNTKCLQKRRPSEYLRQQVLADTMVFSEEGLRHLVAEMGTSQIVYGTDVPYIWPVTVDLVLNASFLSDADKEAILGGNLIRLLRIPAQT